MDSLFFWCVVSAFIIFAWTPQEKPPHSTTIPDDDSNWDRWDDFFGFESSHKKEESCDESR